MNSIPIFDNKLITKYFRNQTPPKNSKEKFTDIFFPPNKTSIFGFLSSHSFKNFNNFGIDISNDNFQWNRLSDLINQETQDSDENQNDYCLFGEKLILNQKSNCLNYFESVANHLIQYPTLVLNLFRQTEINLNGYYEICLFIEGEWQIVIIDDYFPIDTNTKNFLFTQVYENECWILLLEKALSKVNECYLNLYQNFSPIDIFQILTSFPYDIFRSKTINKEIFWEYLKSSMNKKELIFTGKENTKLLLSNGLKSNIHYHIVDYREKLYNDEMIRLLVIKSISSTNWIGAWSQSSHRWNEKTRELFLEFNDSNCFFMDFDEAILLFSNFYVCKILDSFYSYSFFNDNINEYGKQTPHVFTFNINNEYSNNHNIYISLFKTNWRFNRTLMNTNTNHPFFLLLAKFNKKENILEFVDSKCSKMEYESDITIELKGKDLNGSYIIWCFCNYDECSEPKPQQYSIRFLSSCNLEIKANFLIDNNYELLEDVIKTYIHLDNKSEIDNCSEDLFIKTKSQMFSSGFGYIFIANKSSKNYEIVFDNIELVNMKLIKNIKSIISLSSSTNIMIGVIKDTTKKSTFYTNYKIVPYLGNQIIKKKFDWVQFRLFENSTSINVDNFVTYFISDLSTSNSQLKAESFMSEFEKIELIKKLYPEIFEDLTLLSNKENDVNRKNKIKNNLIWTLNEEFDNGFYTGQKCQINGTKNGKGVYEWKTGEKYVGFWSNDKQHSFGIQYGRNKEIIYQGEYFEGQRHGEGKLYLSNGDIYEGTFKHNFFEGPGNYRWKDSNTCWYGAFNKDKLTGVGLLVFPDGNTFLRDFK